MFNKYLFAICVLAFVVVIAEAANPALTAAAKLIAKELGKRVAKCAVEAAQACKSNWKHAHALVECAKKFADSNKGRCLA